MHPTLATISAGARLTLTWDQGSEMARHDLVAGYFSEGIYFARPASPWLRGTNENTNGLLRQYFPKGGDLSVFTPEDLARVEDLLNNRPRRVLGWRTPADVFATAMPS
jgi:IS30 family transposase